METEYFKNWVDRAEEEIEIVRTILDEELSDEPEVLIGDLVKIEKWNGRMGYILAEANSWLDWSKSKNLPDKEGRTEFERKILLDESVRQIKRYRDIIESLVDSIKQRLILGESILSYSKQFAERSVGNNTKPW